jgi:hypothetical protein
METEDSLSRADISKQVGWDEKLITVYPSIAEVQQSTRIDRCRWHRFLISPSTKDEQDVLFLIIKMGF